MAIPDETDALGAALAALNRLVVDQESLDERLRRVAALTCTTISGCDMAAMTLLRDGRSSTDVCTDDTTKEIDSAQYASGSGPCLDAYRFQEPRGIGSTCADRRWPEFARAAREHGIWSTLSLPLFVGERSFGALNLYSRQERGFSEEDGGAGRAGLGGAGQRRSLLERPEPRRRAPGGHAHPGRDRTGQGDHLGRAGRRR